MNLFRLPMLFYSRPKGVYDGNDTKRVMLDYYMINIDDGHYVQADINGQGIRPERLATILH